jgi:hypothetical protein
VLVDHTLHVFLPSTITPKFLPTLVLLQICLDPLSATGKCLSISFSFLRTYEVGCVCLAFGTQNALAELYNTHVDKATGIELTSAVGALLLFSLFLWSGFLFWDDNALTKVMVSRVVLQFSICYAYSISIASAGAVVDVFMAVVIGSVSLAQLPPEMDAINYGCGAAAKLYVTINCVTDIIPMVSNQTKSKDIPRSRTSSSTIPPYRTLWLSRIFHYHSLLERLPLLLVPPGPGS